MAELIYKTSEEFPGPWIIGREHLEEFDRLLDEEWDRLRTYKEEYVRTKVDERLQEWQSFYEDNPSGEERDRWRRRVEKDARERYGSERREIRIRFESGSELVVASFNEAFRNRETVDQVPIDFSVRLACGPIECSVRTWDYDHRMAISVEPSNLQPSRELFVALRDWVQKARPQVWLSLWRKLPAFTVWIVFAFVVSIALSYFQGAREKQDFKQQAHELLEKGLSQEDERKALELLLALSSSYSGPMEKAQLPNRFWFLVIGGLLVCLILSFPPKIVLGIGLGEGYVRTWRRWLRFISVIVPAFVFSNFLWPAAQNFIAGLWTT